MSLSDLIRHISPYVSVEERLFLLEAPAAAPKAEAAAPMSPVAVAETPVTLPDAYAEVLQEKEALERTEAALLEQLAIEASIAREANEALDALRRTLEATLAQHLAASVAWRGERELRQHESEVLVAGLRAQLAQARARHRRTVGAVALGFAMIVCVGGPLGFSLATRATAQAASPEFISGAAAVAHPVPRKASAAHPVAHPTKLAAPRPALRLAVPVHALQPVVARVAPVAPEAPVLRPAAVPVVALPEPEPIDGMTSLIPARVRAKF